MANPERRRKAPRERIRERDPLIAKTRRNREIGLDDESLREAITGALIETEDDFADIASDISVLEEAENW